MELDEQSTFAWSVIFREFEGSEFDTNRMEFKEQK